MKLRLLVVSPGPGVCTFRAALRAANTNQAVAGCAAGSPSGSDLILLPSGTITLSQFASLDITSSLTISGAGDGLTVFRAANSARWIVVTGTVRVNVQGVTVHSLNYGSAGAGVYVPGPTSIVTVTHSSFISNTASPGTIWSNGNVLLDHVTLRGNHGNGAGAGGIYNNYGARLTLQYSTVSANSSALDGGGISNDGQMTITNSTVSGNSAAGNGGGIAVLSGTVSAESSTIVDNSVFDGIGDPATIGSGGVDVFFGAVFKFHQTVIAGNHYDPLFGTPTSDNCYGTLTSLHYNWIEAIPGNCTVSGMNGSDHTGDPKLGLLRDNGGPTWTHAPLSGSGLIDRGDPACALTADQRGVHRPIDGDQLGLVLCDVGAVEYQLPLFLPVVVR